MPESCKPRVLIEVQGGVAYPAYDENAVEVHVADYDNEPNQELPEEFAELLQEGFRDRYADLLKAARDVITNWEQGDLAGAVRKLHMALSGLEK